MTDLSVSRYIRSIGIIRGRRTFVPLESLHKGRLGSLAAEGTQELSFDTVSI